MIFDLAYQMCQIVLIDIAFGVQNQTLVRPSGHAAAQALASLTKLPTGLIGDQRLVMPQSLRQPVGRRERLDWDYSASAFVDFVAALAVRACGLRGGYRTSSPGCSACMPSRSS